MTQQLLTLGLFVLVFALAGWRKVHVGIIALVGAFVVGLSIANLGPEEVIAGFPTGLLILLAGVTLFFGIAQANGTVDKLIDRTLARFSGRNYLIPLVVFVLGVVVSAMAATGALAVIPLAMQIARKHRIDPMLIAVAMGTGLTVGMFSPIGLFGIITYGTAESAGIALNPLDLFGAAIVVNLLLLAAGYAIYGGVALYRQRARTTAIGYATPDAAAMPMVGSDEDDVDQASPSSHSHRLTAIQRLTILTIVAFISLLIVMELVDLKPDIGLIAFAFAGFLLLVDPSQNKAALGHIQWSTILLVGGIITYVSVLQSIGVLEMLGDSAAAIGYPLLAAFALFFVGGLISAFASTTGTLAAIVPLAVPLTETGGFAPWAAIAGLALCSALADIAPFSTVGATMAATAPEWDGSARTIQTRLLSWGMAMVVVGPILMLGLLLVT